MGDTSAAPSSGSSRLKVVREWFTLENAIRVASADPTSLDDRQRSLLARAHGALVVADRVSPADGATVPLEDAGDELARASVAIAALRDAVAWSLAAGGSDSPTSLSEAWQRADEADLERAAGSADDLARARRALVADDALARGGQPIDEVRKDLAAARRLANSLVQRLDTRATRVTRLRGQRWIRTLSAAALLVALVLGLDVLAIVRRPDLVPTARWTASSADLGWPPNGVGMSGRRPAADVFFHTREQDNPFVQFDLGSSRSIARVVVVNRADCCQDRAAPLSIEISDDGRAWREIASNSSAFDTWDELFFRSRRARYVRLIARRHTILHFRRVEIH